MSGDRATLVGRERHLNELQLLIDGVIGGRGGLVVLSGDAGAGKTRLAEEAAALARASGIEVGWATGWGSGSAPLSAWSDLLTTIDPKASPTVTTAADDNDANREAARLLLVRSLVARLRDTVRGRPVLLIVDDAQWCDPLSLHAIETLAASVRSTPMALVATLRDEGPPSIERFATLTRMGRHLVVPPLTNAELGNLAVRLTGRKLSPQSIRTLHERSAGNVLYATELLANPAADALDSREGASGIGSNATAIFANRLSTLTPKCQRMLEAASVIGRRFRLDVLCETLGTTEEPVLTAIGDAHAAGIVRDNGIGAYEFSHPLIAEACYTSSGLPRRVRLHRDVGEALERLRHRGLSVPSAELAHHFAAAAAAGAAAKAVHYAAAAGRESMEQLAYEDAARDFGRALAAVELCPVDDAGRADLLLKLGDAHAAAGDPPSARTAYETAARVARDHHWPDRLARAALGIGSGPGGFEVPAFDDDQIALLEEAASVAEGPQRAQVLARLAVALSLDVDSQRRTRLCEEAIAAARAADDPLAPGYALASWCDLSAGPADVEPRLTAVAEILACAARANDTPLELLGRRLRVVALLEAGAIFDVDDEITAFARRADRLGQVVYTWYVPLWRALRATMEGRFDDADRFRRDAARLGEAAHSENAAMLTGSQLAMLRCEVGNPDGIGFFEDVTVRWPALAIMARPGLAYAYAASDDVDRAREILDAVNVDAYSIEMLGLEWLPSIVMLTYAVALTGTVALAEALYTTLLPFRSRHAIDGIGCFDMGSVERPLGMLASLRGDRSRAAEHFDAALAAHKKIGARLLVAGTLRDAGRCLDDTAMLAEADAHYAALGLDHPTNAATQPEDATRGNVFRPEGEMWLVGLNGTNRRVRDTKGMRDVARLLAQPGRELHALDLVVDGPTLDAGPAGDAIDESARSQYQARLAEIEDELEEADERADAGHSERLHAERDALIAELAHAFGLGGRTRPRGDTTERARSAVTQRIRVAISRIEAADPDLGHHLRRSVRTGTFCSYEPEHPVHWQL